MNGSREVAARDRQIETERYMQTESVRQADRQADCWTDRQTDRQKGGEGEGSKIIKEMVGSRQTCV